MRMDLLYKKRRSEDLLVDSLESVLRLLSDVVLQRTEVFQSTYSSYQPYSSYKPEYYLSCQQERLRILLSVLFRFSRELLL